MNACERRLMFVLELADQIGDVDLHAKATEYAERESPGSEPNEFDYLNAIRFAIDKAQGEEA
jgi:hypothetical protein